MTWIGIVVSIVTFIVGLVLGGLGGVYYLRRQMSNMQMSQTDIQNMARSMGMNLNQKQLNQVQKRMKNSNANTMKNMSAKKKKK
ncbi:MAG TPA: YneF family protein [Bacilli bacterium]|nr:YneF family protein [Bacilli bacterium]